ncbi:hypothetical protein [Cohnella sp. AR92]|uniref:hypothetical protein n=1 Tax=Cohnella sp. AR92 TaxID=648716 RepID=UPI000F8C694E|nr:hypothetical protein [Cohnella sp. AR92]RUS46990.1 hypothetical protein ELR57_11330 [Cohnella sp. AR92]
MKVVMLEKNRDGSLVPIDEREWTHEMLESLHHVNYCVLGSQEYQTLEGRLNLDLERMELLVVKMLHED